MGQEQDSDSLEPKPIYGHICIRTLDNTSGLEAKWRPSPSIVCSMCGRHYPHDHIDITIDERELPKLKILLALIH